MNFTKEYIPKFDNEPIPYEDTEKYPQPPKESGLPQSYFTNLTIGATGSGKSFSVCKLLKYYEKWKYYDYYDKKVVPQRIIIFAPTFETNPIYRGLKNLDLENDVHMTYSDELLKEVLDDILTVKKEALNYCMIKKAFRQYKEGVDVDKINQEALILLMAYEYDMNNVPVPKYKRPPTNHIIFDDLVSTSAYKSNGTSLLSNLSVRNRHVNANLYFLAQTVKQIPKIIRTQARVFMIYRYNSKTLVEDLYETVSGILTPEQFTEIYNSASEDRFNFLTIDNTQGVIILKQNFNILIKMKNEKIETKNLTMTKIKKDKTNL